MAEKTNWRAISKRYFLIVMALFIGLLNVSFASYAIDYECGPNAYWNFSGNTLTIYGTGRMYDFNRSSDVPWNTFANSIKNVYINEGITYLGARSFEYRENLVSIQLPSTLKEIGKWSFYLCKSLSTILIPEGVEKIQEYAFDTSGLKKIYFPKTLKRIEKHAFSDVGKLTTIYYGGTEYNWKNISIDYSFGTSNQYLESAEKIYNYNFKWNSTYTWSADNRKVYASRFLTDFDIYETETADTYLSSASKEDGVSYVAKFTNPAFSAKKKLKTLRLPDKITKVSEEAFRNASFEAVIIPSSCKSIESKAFAYNPNLKIVIAIDVDRASDAFEGCGDIIFIDNSQYITSSSSTNPRQGDYIDYWNGDWSYWGKYY